MKAIFPGFGSTFGFDMSPSLNKCGEDCPIGIGEKGKRNGGMDIGGAGKLSTLIDLPKDEANLRIPGMGAEVLVPDLMPDIVIDDTPLKIDVPQTELPKKDKQLHFGSRLNLVG